MARMGPNKCCFMPRKVQCNASQRVMLEPEPHTSSLLVPALPLLFRNLDVSLSVQYTPAGDHCTTIIKAASPALHTPPAPPRKHVLPTVLGSGVVHPPLKLPDAVMYTTQPCRDRVACETALTRCQLEQSGTSGEAGECLDRSSPSGSRGSVPDVRSGHCQVTAR